MGFSSEITPSSRCRRLRDFDEELSWIEQTTEFADRAAGIAYQKDEVDDGASA